MEEILKKIRSGEKIKDEELLTLISELFKDELIRDRLYEDILRIYTNRKAVFKNVI